jgi:hypothetical protein
VPFGAALGAESPSVLSSCSVRVRRRELRQIFAQPRVAPAVVRPWETPLFVPLQVLPRSLCLDAFLTLPIVDRYNGYR